MNTCVYIGPRCASNPLVDNALANDTSEVKRSYYSFANDLVVFRLLMCGLLCPTPNHRVIRESVKRYWLLTFADLQASRFAWRQFLSRVLRYF